MQKEKLAEILSAAASRYNFVITADMIDQAVYAGAPADEETGEVNSRELAGWLEWQKNQSK